MNEWTLVIKAATRVEKHKAQKLSNTRRLLVRRSSAFPSLPPLLGIPNRGSFASWRAMGMDSLRRAGRSSDCGEALVAEAWMLAWQVGGRWAGHGRENDL